MKKILSCAYLVVIAAAALAADEKPPLMGWSSWNTYRVNINEQLILKQARLLVELGLKDCGYNHVNIDDGFFGGRDPAGRLKTHPERFPNGLKGIVDGIHSLGLKAGIYSDGGANTCGSFWDKDKFGIGVGFYLHDEEDADYYFREHDFDFIKVDFCGGDPRQNFDKLALDERQRYTAIRRAIDAAKPGVRMNICRWDFPGTWAAELADSWRISHDIRPRARHRRSVWHDARRPRRPATGSLKKRLAAWLFQVQADAPAMILSSAACGARRAESTSCR